MIRMNMINKLIMIIMPNDQIQAFINITITKETTAERSKVDLLVRNFTLKNNEIYDLQS